MFLKKSQGSGPEFIICGLGNPGIKYTNTRHNAGFMAVDALAEQHKIKIDRSKFKSLTNELKLGDKKILLLKPQTFMNLSGQAVKQAADFYKIPSSSIIVVFDDVSLEAGRMRVRGKGSAGGHNGIKSIIAELDTDEFPRLKLGVGEQKFSDLADWVLSKFDKDEQKVMDKIYTAAVDALAAIVRDGVESAANRFNGFTV